MKIEKSILLRAPQATVWRALTTPAEFGQWFGVEIDGVFEPGARVRMKSLLEDCGGEVFHVVIEKMEYPRLFSWRWHPGMVEPGVDYSSEPTTLVAFELEEATGGTRLTVVESGFDRISLARRARVYEQNVHGWKEQMAAIENYLREAAA
jgi:uncharacterized protein YndB with AHSA1/START domain